MVGTQREGDVRESRCHWKASDHEEASVGQGWTVPAYTTPNLLGGNLEELGHRDSSFKCLWSIIHKGGNSNSYLPHRNRGRAAY